MLRNKLVRSDGSIIDSSVIISCEFTEEVNSSTNLSVGDVTASELTVEILSADHIQQDEVLTYSIIEDGVETKIGVFKAEKPTVATRTSMRFSAYDNVVKTEKSFSDWLRNNQDKFPMPLLTLVQYACSYCGADLATTDFPHANLSVGAFYADDITCRQILAWAATVAGRFVRANADGELEFAWYASTANITITPSGAITSTTIPFLRDKLSYESYTTDLIERVQINHSEDDVGVIYPEAAAGNCFTISGNMILGVVNREDITEVAQSLYEQLKSVAYVPFSVTVPRTIRVRAGDKISALDSEGNTFDSYVMKVIVTPSGTTLSATGDKSYESNAAVSSEKYTNLTGKILSISKSIDGLVIENKDLSGKLSGLELSIDGYKTYVEETYVSDSGFEEKYKSVSAQTTKEINEHFEALDNFKNETSANIKTGLLGYTDDTTPLPIYGIEVGQRTKNAAGEEIFNQYARFTSDKLSFYDQGGNEVTQIGDKKMAVTNVEITGSHDGDSEEYGTFKQGNFVDITQADGGIVSKWVGGA